MTATLDDRYLEWLYGLVASVRNRNPDRSYWALIRQLYVKEFVWLVANDDNRVEDGRELRLEFLRDQDYNQVDQAWLDLGCSTLEMLIALARRAAFEAGKSPGHWFWEMLDNVGLRDYTDSNLTRYSEGEIDEIVNRIIFRTYAVDGSGGLFPLKEPAPDQRKVELWYQLNAYLLERTYS